MTDAKPYYQLVPANVLNSINDIEAVIMPKIKGYKREYLYEVVSILASHVRKDNKPAQLQISYIKQLVPQGDRYLHELINLRIIDRTGTPLKGLQSYQYSFSETYYSRYIAVALLNQFLINRINKTRGMNRGMNIMNKSNTGRLQQAKYLKLLTIVEGYINALPDEIHKHNCQLAAANRIIQKDFFYSVDKTSERFHSNITNMSKLIRPFLLLDREHTVNIDIKNSQPYLSTVLLTDPAKLSIFTKNGTFPMLLQSLEPLNSEDVTKYISLVNSGGFYEYMMNELSNIGIFITRDEVKKLCLRLLYRPTKAPKNKPENRNIRTLRTIFKKSFPNVWKRFAVIRGNKRGNHFYNFKRLPILMQSIESYLILEVILPQVLRIPDCKALTIHDSVICNDRPYIVEGITTIMEKELFRFTGYKPRLSVERHKQVVNEPVFMNST